MGLKKINKKIKLLVNEAYWKGWNDGYSADNTDFDEGWTARGQNIKTRLKMLEDAYMKQGKGSKAVMVREIADLIDIQVEWGEFDSETEDDIGR